VQVLLADYAPTLHIRTAAEKAKVLLCSCPWCTYAACAATQLATPAVQRTLSPYLLFQKPYTSFMPHERLQKPQQVLDVAQQAAAALHTQICDLGI
jgi:hypothetical protein